MARVRLSANGAALDLTNVEPSGGSFKVTLLRDGKRKHLPAHALAEAIDANTGEVIGNPVDYFRALWARKVCGPQKRWPLPELINALAIKGLGPHYARKIAAAIGTWDRFMRAIAQLRTIELPSSTDDIEYARFEAAIKQGLVDTMTTEHGVNTILGDVVFHTSVSQSFGDGPPLPPAYPEPLNSLMGAVGPRLWRSLRDWADGSRSADDVRTLMQFGSPTDYVTPKNHVSMAGMMIVLTGMLQSMTREEAQRAIEQAGGRVQASVTEMTTAVVAGSGADGGAKLRQAEKLDVDVWTEDEFVSALGAGKT